MPDIGGLDEAKLAQLEIKFYHSETDLTDVEISMLITRN